MTQGEVAEAMNLTQKVVWRLMLAHDIQRRPAVKRNQLGENNPSWKGARAKYAALHLRVQTLRGKPQKCESCGCDEKHKTYEWANLTGQYDNPSDYKRMCGSCHKRFDRIHLNLGAYALPKGVMPSARKD